MAVNSAPLLLLRRREVSMDFDWVLAQWCLSIWNPSLMDWVPDKKRRNSRRMFYRAMGIVVHDRVLNGRPAWH